MHNRDRTTRVKPTLNWIEFNDRGRTGMFAVLSDSSMLRLVPAPGTDPPPIKYVVAFIQGGEVRWVEAADPEEACCSDTSYNPMIWAEAQHRKHEDHENARPKDRRDP